MDGQNVMKGETYIEFGTSTWNWRFWE